MRLFLGWTLFTAAALVGQNALHGLDLLGPGLALCLRQGRIKSVFWLAPFWAVIQEGIGNLPFGTALLLYGGLPVLSRGLKWMLDPGTWVFTILLALLATAWERVVLHLLLSLQDIPLSIAGGWERFLLQTVAYLLVVTVGSLILKRVS